MAGRRAASPVLRWRVTETKKPDPPNQATNTTMPEHTPYQKRVIKRYYEHRDEILFSRLSELVTNLYLAEGKKREKLWESAGELMEKLKVPASRIKHLMAKKDPALLAELVKELEAK